MMEPEDTRRGNVYSHKYNTYCPHDGARDTRPGNVYSHKYNTYCPHDGARGHSSRERLQS